MVWTIEGTPGEERSHGGIRVLTTGIIHCSLTAEFALITPPLHAWISRAGPSSASASSNNRMTVDDEDSQHNDEQNCCLASSG